MGTAAKLRNGSKVRCTCRGALAERQRLCSHNAPQNLVTRHARACEESHVDLIFHGRASSINIRMFCVSFGEVLGAIPVENAFSSKLSGEKQH